MSLDPVKQWTLVCSGLVAHADGVLDGSECERLMGLLEAAEGLDGDEYGAWMSAIGSPARLEELLEILEPPDAQHHRELLEGAWVMAIVDGARTADEGAMIERLADRLGVEPIQLDYWREAWAVAEREFATAVAAVLGYVLGAGAPALERERAAIRDTMWSTPCDQALRDALIAKAMAPLAREDAARELSGLARARRVAALQRTVGATRRAASPDEAKARLIDVAWAASINAEIVARWFR